MAGRWVVACVLALAAGPAGAGTWTLQGVVTDAQPEAGRVALAVDGVGILGGPWRRLDPPAGAVLLGGAALDGVAPGAALALTVETPDTGGWPAVLPLAHLRLERAAPSAAAPPPGEVPPSAAAPALPDLPLDPDGVSPAEVVVPLVFPVAGGLRWSDTFLAGRDGGKRRHHGQDLVAPKLTPVLAAFDGVVWFRRKSEADASNTLTLRGDHGWSGLYVHLNNDTPGTDDGLGSPEYTYPAWLQPGDRVQAGELVGWAGDSGNAEATVAHLHFELHHESGAKVNPAPSLRAAPVLAEPRLPAPGVMLQPRDGEVGVEGVVQSVDPARGVIIVALQARTTPKQGRAGVVRPQRGYLTTADAMIHPAGLPEERLTLAQLPPGTPLAAVGKDNRTSVAARQIAADLRGLAPSAELRAVLEGRG